MERATFQRENLLAAFDRIGAVAADNRTLLDIAVYRGSALMLASNFRYATEDVDIAELGTVWPQWLADEVASIAADNGWSAEWLNDAVQFHLSPIADRGSDHVEFGTFPRDGEPGLRISVPSLEYMLALKLKAMRITDPAEGVQEAEDIRNLLAAAGVKNVGEAISTLARFFPRSAREPDTQRFFLKHLWPPPEPTDAPPTYPLRRD